MNAPEHRFNNIIEAYKMVILSDSKLDIINYYNLQGEWLMEYNKKRGHTWISYWYIWSVFEKKYNMNYNEIEQFMKNMMLIHFKIKETTPIANLVKNITFNEFNKLFTSKIHLDLYLD